MYSATIVIFVVLALTVLPATSSVEEEWIQIADDDGKLHWVNLKEEPIESKVSEDDVSFRLYTKKASSPVLLKIGSSSLGTFDYSDETVFVIHGWTSNPDRPSVRNITLGYLQTAAGHNVVEVDWSGPAAPAYPTAVKNAREVAVIVAQFLDFLVSRGLSLAKLNVVGFSLGAHVAGMTGFRVTSGTVARVTGLDPAGPLFYTATTANKLGRVDAAFVQVIHTNGGIQGYLTSLGHADFYPNGGTKQDGCGSDLNGSCAHHRAPAFYAESITSKTQFTAVSCTSWTNYRLDKCSSNPTAIMGAYTPTSTRGNYWLKTNAAAPYAKG